MNNHTVVHGNRLVGETDERQALQHMPYEGVSAKQGAASECEVSFWRSFLPGLDELDFNPRFLEHAYV